MNKQLFAVLSYYLKITGISFDKTKLKQLITSHPDRDSLYAMTDVLDELSIDNIALRTDMKGLLTNGFPVIVFTEKEVKKFIVVEDILDDYVHYYSAEKGCSIESLDDFTGKWTGVALYAAQDEIQSELAKKKTKSEKRLLKWRTILAVVTGLASIAIWCISVMWSCILVGLLLLCILGLVFSILLTLQDFGESNSFLHKVCHLNRITNCNAVHRSAAAKLFGWLKMSDIGLSYFTGSFFSLILAGIGQKLDTVASLLLILALCSLPYTLFSLSYQLFKVKKICPMCIGVIGVLWVEIALALSNFKGLVFSSILPITVFSLLTGFALPVIIWVYKNVMSIL